MGEATVSQPQDLQRQLVPQPIRALDEQVVNRIAAGEVIQRPASALKELLENSLDAGATQINIVVKDGGLKLLQIQDNGHGIRKEDLQILCHRHTTSKLKEFDDLETIGTFGFRGEALSSISFVSHMTVTTMTSEQHHGWRVSYKDGEMDAAGPSACAAVQGTTLVAEDMFYNVPTRRKALKSTADEYSRVLDVVSRYAVCYAGVGMSCKRQGEARTDVHTLPGASTLDNIRAVYGAPVARDLLPLNMEVGRVADDVTLDAAAALKLKAYVSGMNYTGRRATQLLLFINGRAVEHSMLKRALEATYAQVLPKVQKPFIYMDLRLPPRHVEVNLHPTKKEVGFINQEEIVEMIRGEVERVLCEANNTRTFTQATLPFAPLPAAVEATQEPSAYYRPDKLVRTDPRSQSLEATFLNPAKAAALAGSVARKRPGAHRNSQAEDGPAAWVPAPSNRPAGQQCVSDLASIQELWAEVEAQAHANLTDIIRTHTFVGMADERWAVAQHGTRLYLMDAQALSRDLFYQQLLRSWGQHQPLRITPPAAIEQLMLAALDLEEAAGSFQEAVDGPKGEVARLAAELLGDKAELLSDSIAMEVAGGALCSIPLLLEGHSPDLMRLPDLVLRLARDVDWTTESGCFQSLAEVLAEFYSFQPDIEGLEDDGPPVSGSGGEAITRQGDGEGANGAAARGETASGDADVSMDEAAPLDLRQEDRMQEDGPTKLKPTGDADSSSLTGQGATNSAAPAAASTQTAAQPDGTARLRARNWTIQHVLFPAMKAQLRVPRQRASDGSVVQLTSLEKLYRVFERC